MWTRLAETFPLYQEAFLDTLWMVGVALFLASLLGFPLGVLLVITRPGHIFENKWLYHALNVIINILRSVPFIILLVAIIPLTRFLVGTSIGIKGALVPLVVYLAPYLARLLESALLEVDPGVIEAFQAMGASRRQIIIHVLLREARPGLVLATTIAAIGLIDATAMAGFVGAGGLGDLAVRYGYQRYQEDVMLVTVLLLIVIVQAVQSFGNALARKLRKK
ncbi:ABC transporter permease [Bacillaceae bacterium]